MELEIEKLLNNLDSKGKLNILPCFYERPDKIQFRIGFNEGPKIEFQQETPDYYYLIVADEIGNLYRYAIHIGNKQFEKCQSIYHKIRVLCLNNEYSEYRENNIGIMITNLKQIIEPILSRV